MVNSLTLLCEITQVKRICAQYGTINRHLIGIFAPIVTVMTAQIYFISEAAFPRRVRAHSPRDARAQRDDGSVDGSEGQLLQLSSVILRQDSPLLLKLHLQVGHAADARVHLDRRRENTPNHFSPFSYIKEIPAEKRKTSMQSLSTLSKQPWNNEEFLRFEGLEVNLVQLYNYFIYLHFSTLWRLWRSQI